MLFVLSFNSKIGKQFWLKEKNMPFIYLLMSFENRESGMILLYLQSHIDFVSTHLNLKNLIMVKL